MKRLATTLTILSVFAFATQVNADDKKDSKKGDRPERKVPAQILERFDTDKDGKLSDEERAKARAEMAKRRGGEGRPSREELIKKFDKDGDGELSAEEREAAKAEMQK